MRQTQTVPIINPPRIHPPPQQPIISQPMPYYSMNRNFGPFLQYGGNKSLKKSLLIFKNSRTGFANRTLREPVIPKTIKIKMN